MILNKIFFLRSLQVFKFALKIVYFESFLVWKLFFKRNIPTNLSVKLMGSIMERLVPDVTKGPGNFRWFTTPTSIIKMRFSKSTPQPQQICLSETVRQNG